MKELLWYKIEWTELAYYYRALSQIHDRLSDIKMTSLSLTGANGLSAKFHFTCAFD